MRDDVTGIILCGGTGSRLYPLTKSVNKHLLPVFSKPMVYYPFSLLMLLGCKNFIIVCNENDKNTFEQLFSWTTNIDISVKYVVQLRPVGVVDAIIQTIPQISTSKIFVSLGDNIFFGTNLITNILASTAINVPQCVFSYKVDKPEQFGVVVRNKIGHATNFVEKPNQPLSDEAITGLYFFDVEFLKKNICKIVPSDRNELEIIDYLNLSLQMGNLNIYQISRGTFWIDAGTIEDLFKACEFVKIQEERTGQLILCPEQIARDLGLMSMTEMTTLLENYPISGYKNFLNKVDNL